MNEASAHYDLGINYQSTGNENEALKDFSVFKEIVSE
jgi:hypothetical protein